jgi:nucleoid-associated protein YgaU
MPYHIHKVQPGDTLSSIARQYLANAALWPGLASYNRLDPNQALALGTSLQIPITDYVVQRGDTLRKIAQQQAGNPDLWQTIAQLNAIANPQDLRIGQRLQVPNPYALASATPPAATIPPTKPSTPSPPATRPTTSQPIPPLVLPKPPATSPATPPAKPPTSTLPIPSNPIPSNPSPPKPTVPTSVPQTYRVQPGESLYEIARKTLGSGDRWPEIAALNALRTPNSLTPGTVLRIPQPPIATQYKVQPGDTLYRIAVQTLGDGDRWPEIASLNRLNPSAIAPGLLLNLPAPALAGTVPMPLPLNIAQGKSLSSEGRVTFINQGDSLYATWIDPKRENEKVGVRYEAGLFRPGIYRPKEMIDRAPASLDRLKLTSSERKIIAAVASNEGSLDAVNTWDKSYLSFGIFQWTLGRADVPGELAALLFKLKQRYPDEFTHYFGQFGLDIDSANPNSGWLSLFQQRLTTDAEKNQLRQPTWAYRFAIAGSDIAVQSIQILHAIARLDQFYFAKQAALDGFSLSQLITSEYGVALLLDHHVNRPSYVAKAVAESLWQTQLTPEQLTRAKPEAETNLINQYVRVRPTIGSLPMTHAVQRGDRLRALVTSGYLSADRGSFQSNKADRT